MSPLLAPALRNVDPAELPPACDILVVGAGPAGSAAAMVLARAGLDVRLVDQAVFPRDKICGDGLIADSHAALRRLGLLDQVLARARSFRGALAIGTRGSEMPIPSTVAVLPRRELDDLLCQEAVRSGAPMYAPARFVEIRCDSSGRVVGAVLQSGRGHREIRTQMVVLATGAPPQGLLAASVCQRKEPSGIAMRGYFSHPMAKDLDSVRFLWNRDLRRGYAWIFPAPGGLLNVGVYLSHPQGGRFAGKDLRLQFDRLHQWHPLFREIITAGEPVGGPQGSPLRCSLEGSDPVRPGLLVVGEAAGTTYLATGEGIGKAMETGILAAEAIIRARAGTAPEGLAEAAYREGLDRLRPRFDLYRQANRFNALPWMIDLLIWRGRRSPRLRHRIHQILDETGSPADPFSFRVLRRLVLG